MFMQTTVVEVDTGHLLWPPAGLDPAAMAFFGYWLAGDRLAYNEFLPAAFAQAQFDPQNVRLMLWDTDRATTVAGPVGLGLIPDLMRRAPDRRTLAVLAMEPDRQSSPGAWGVLPAAGGALTLVATEAFPPAWSPDSRTLAFVHRDQTNGGFSLHTWPLNGHTFTRLWNSQDTPELAVDEQTQFSLAWSPDGAWLALAAWQSGSNAESGSNTGWLALIPAEGGALRLIGADQAPASSLSFSSDGRWLAAILSNNQSADLVVYDVRRGVEYAHLRNGWWQQPQWSPRANRLLAFQNERPYLIEQPGGEPVPLGDMSCSTGAWRP
jgi:Tol biopolymer transport system component